MTQYQPPYQPPDPLSQQGNFAYYQPQDDPIAPAKRASIAMYIAGAILLLMGACFAGTSAMLPQVLAQEPELASRLSTNPAYTPELMQRVMLIGGVVILVVGIGMIVLGVFVARGGLGAIVTGLVLTAVVLLYLLSNIVLALVGGIDAAPAMCMLSVPTLLFVVLLVLLIQAARASGRVKAMREHYTQQYWQYAYQQQMYQQQHQPPPLPPYPPRGPNDPAP